MYIGIPIRDNVLQKKPRKKKTAEKLTGVRIKSAISGDHEASKSGMETLPSDTNEFSDLDLSESSVSKMGSQSKDMNNTQDSGFRENTAEEIIDSVFEAALQKKARLEKAHICTAVNNSETLTTNTSCSEYSDIDPSESGMSRSGSQSTEVNTTTQESGCMENTAEERMDSVLKVACQEKKDSLVQVQVSTCVSNGALS